MTLAFALVGIGAMVVGNVSGAIILALGFAPFVESPYDVNLVAPRIRRPLKAEGPRARGRVAANRQSRQRT